MRVLLRSVITVAAGLMCRRARRAPGRRGSVEQPFLPGALMSFYPVVPPDATMGCAEDAALGLLGQAGMVAVQAAGHPADHARLGVAEQRLDELCGVPGVIEEAARSAVLG